MINPLVSVVIPLYNSEKTIEKTIQSVLNQSYFNVEIIVIENGSTDNSYNKVLKYVDANDLKLTSSSIKSASHSRNLGFNISKGDYILFLDSDDILGVNYIENHIQYLKLVDFDSSIITIGFFDFIQREVVSLNVNDHFLSENRKELLNNLFLSHNDFMLQTSCFLVPRNFCEKYKWKNYLTLDDDGDFIFCILSHFDKIKILRNNRFHYRMKTETITLSKTRNKRALLSALICQENKFILAKDIAQFEKNQLIRNQIKIVKDFYFHNGKLGFLGLRLLFRKYSKEEINKLVFDKYDFLNRIIWNLKWLNIFFLFNSFFKKNVK